MKSIKEAAGPVRQPVWDLPTRLFHWTLAALIGFSWWSAEEGPIGWHMWSGYAVLTLLLFRLLWGLAGSSTARFSSFVRGPATLFSYLRDPKGWKSAGHTPLGALSVLAMLAVLFIQVGTGLFQTDDDGLVEGPLAGLVSYQFSDAMHDWHELSFDALKILIVLHIAAILIYWLFLKKRLVGAMINGKAALDPEVEPMRPGRWWAALLCLAIALGVTRWIIAGLPPIGG